MSLSVAPIAPADHAQRAERVSRRVTRWMTAIALLSAPLCLLWALIRDPGPVWRAQYFGNTDLAGAAFVRSERELGVYWDERHPTVEGSTIAGHNLSMRWDTCLQLDQPREIPFQLVSDGSASFSVDGQEQLHLDDEQNRGARGDVLRLAAGAHRLLVEMSSVSWGSLALNASFDGRAPRALGSREKIVGVRLRYPAAADPVCP